MSGGGGETVDPSAVGGGDAGADFYPGGTYSGSSDPSGSGPISGGGSGVDWQKVLKAAQQLGDGGSGQGQGVQNIPGSGMPGGLKIPLGTPAHAGALTALLQMLNQRRDMYLNAATNPRAGAVQQPPPGPGLLGV